jgi:prepilin-type N-terminal cleavage/methylation domain-containing protein
MRAARPDERGFTFLEIIVVVLLIALVSAVMVTRIGARTAAPLKSSARFLSAELEYVAQRAIATGHAQRWVVDLDGQHFRIEQQLDPPEPMAEGGDAFDLAAPLPPDEWEPIPDHLGAWRALDENTVGIASVVIAGEPLKKGQAAIHFAPDGGADPADVWLLDDENRVLRVAVTAFTGEVFIAEGERGAS